MESIIVGYILILFGALNAIRPDILMRFQIWSQKKIMGAKYEPSYRTYTVMRFIGGILILIGILAVMGVIK